MDPFFGTYNWYDQPAPFRQSFSRSNVASQNPKYVRIPVHFSGSKPVNRSAFATKIQKVFRGFLVRRSMKRIMDVKKQVDLIDESLFDCEIVDLVRKVEKERLRMSESLMSLLFKLDSVRGFDLGVRECRKRVIRKAIALQERIDAIVTVDLSENDEKVENDEDSGEIGAIVDVGVDSNEVTKNVDFIEEGLVEKDGKSDIGDWVEVVEDGKEETTGRGFDDKKRNNELMERMMEDNAKMMDMMTQLFESNEKQMQMLSTLSERVEMLEKALVCEKRRKKKQKKKTGSLEMND